MVIQSGSALLELQAPIMTDPWCAKGLSAYPENQVSLSRPFSIHEDLGIPFSSDPELATKAYMGVILIITLCSRAVVIKYRLNLDKLRRFHTVAGEHRGAMGGRGDRRGRWAPGGARGWGKDSLTALPCSSREFQTSKFECEYHKGVFAGRMIKHTYSGIC